MEDYYALITKYAGLFVKHHCNVIDITTREPDRYDQMRDVTIARGVQFWHDDHKQYIYWSWIHPDKKYKSFAGTLFDALARQGFDHRTVDNFRVDYRAGRIYQRNLPLK
ncbi:hypothetical protein pEaSNUABM48_00237 [Erwinia phage pEa_SNUABM_48]|nr:hypothetical protein pEaSNUABM48_00237 [Erwinia phage pEa_SNUABM_48]